MLFSSSLVSLVALVAVLPGSFAVPAQYRARELARFNRLARADADPQSSPNLDPSQIQTGLEQDGQATVEAGQVPSATSSNNFINFCLTQNVPLTNGQQIPGGSCDPTPIGVIPAKSKMPSIKFTSPGNNSNNLTANKKFTVDLVVKNLQTGVSTDPKTTYLAAPQTLNSEGIILGNTYITIQELPSLASLDPIDPNTFQFFQGITAKPGPNGELSVTVDKGLGKGFYRMSTINTAANHQPCIGPVAQRGSFEDVIYFEVK